MKKQKRFLAVLPVVAFNVFVSASIHSNQVGYYPSEKKMAIITGSSADSFQIISATGNAVMYKGACLEGGYWDASEESTRIVDFSSFNQNGNFKIRVEGQTDSYPFTIKNNVHYDCSKSAIKAFYYNRVSTVLEFAYAGQWERPMGHEDRQVMIHSSAASDKRPAGTKISSPGGWYDAGDYGKYIVNSGISMYTLLLSYVCFPTFYDTLKLNIPESSNGVPDLLDEILWNLQWMLTMQDPDDGGVYHKLTTKQFCGEVMPHEDNAERFIMKKSTAATLDFAAVAAQSSRVLRKFENRFPGLADSCLQSALKAWRWARQNPAEKYVNPSEVNTGQYGDDSLADEFFWAGTELFVATSLDSFYTIGKDIYGSRRFDVPWWGDVATLGLITLMTSKEDISDLVDKKNVLFLIDSLAKVYYKRYETHPYRIMMSKKDFVWGSNSVAANQAVVLLIAYLSNGNRSYRDAALGTLDYLLGKNPNAFCFMTGTGSKRVMNIHHRQSNSDGISDPVPGFVAGGPNQFQNEYPDCEAWNGCPKYPYPKGTKAAMSYVDEVASYASNEVAINWNAPLVFLTGAFEALQNVEISGIKKSITHHKNISNLLNYTRTARAFSIDLPAGYSASASIIDLKGKIIQKAVFDGGRRFVIHHNGIPQIVMVQIDAISDTGKRVKYVSKILVD